MSRSQATLFMLCGKIASGKSTMAAELAASKDAVLISEDRWLEILFGDEMQTLKDFMRCSGKLRATLTDHIVALLQSGVSVVLDFQANTIESRRWMRGLVEAADAAHELHVLNVPDAVCLDRLRHRNARHDHPFEVTEEQFHSVSQYFVPPTPQEGFTLIEHALADQ
ncbi:AAA family ATPase [Thalassococcus lentus]|uniref:ATP-binding protein n=1 Tax=Thalassococcus lentus TaxID=1210524 RepID=A0ABT4XUZ0_9RHOB|nr:ATP-binding protein [Thalassococcus lentus]MDA7425781.1 ATP-binding protein [Thalassococcus lentus]